jgi:hypothetical protein
MVKHGREQVAATLAAEAVLLVDVPGEDLAPWAYITDGDGVPVVQPAQRRGPWTGQALQVWPLRKRGGARGFRDVVLVGRATSNDVVIAHSTVSKLHARLRAQGGSWSLEDADSTNGTYVNGSRAHPDLPVLLADQDHLALGMATAQVLRLATLLDALERHAPTPR